MGREIFLPWLNAFSTTKGHLMSQVFPRRPAVRVVTDASGHTIYEFSVAAHPAAHPAAHAATNPATHHAEPVTSQSRPAAARAGDPVRQTTPRNALERRRSAELRRLSRGSDCSLTPVQAGDVSLRWSDVKASLFRFARPAR